MLATEPAKPQRASAATGVPRQRHGAPDAKNPATIAHNIDDSEEQLRIHPITLAFSDERVETDFRRQQIFNHFALHTVIATVVVCNILTAAALDPEVRDILLLGYLPNVLMKYPLFWWVTRNNGARLHLAGVLLSGNLSCYAVADQLSVWWLAPNGRAGGAPAALLFGISFVLLTFQSHFYMPFRVRWLMWCLITSKLVFNPGLLDMPKHVEIALLSAAFTWGALLAWCLDRSQRMQHGALLAQTRLNLRLRRAELERQTRKILNHTAKRVMANAEQARDMAMRVTCECDTHVTRVLRIRTAMSHAPCECGCV